MSANQKNLIEKYFWSLVERFITNTQHQNIMLVFTENLGSDGEGTTLGHTEWEPHWTVTSDGVEVPGSRYNKYIVTFLNRYPDGERWRGTVCHEFAHLYLFDEIGDHRHDDLFYSQMDFFEDWLDKKWNLPPRQDKSGDWQQHIDPAKRQQRQQKPVRYPHYQPHQENNPLLLSASEQQEYHFLLGLLEKSKDLTELEQNYREVKSSPVYSNVKRRFANQPKTVKIELDEVYKNRKNFHSLVHFMKNSKSLSHLKKIYQSLKNSPLYHNHQSKLDQLYNDLESNFSANENKSNSKFWMPLLIGGGIVIAICLTIKLLSLLLVRPPKKKNN